MVPLVHSIIEPVGTSPRITVSTASASAWIESSPSTTRSVPTGYGRLRTGVAGMACSLGSHLDDVVQHEVGLEVLRVASASADRPRRGIERDGEPASCCALRDREAAVGAGAAAGRDGAEDLIHRVSVRHQALVAARLAEHVELGL